MVGTTIGKYRFVARLGRGGMGTVYKAIDETLDREVAIKVLNSDISDPRLMTRFRAEATMLARLNHPQIATIYEIYHTDDDLLMVMELVRGETLDQLTLRTGPLAADRAASLVAQILGALTHAHRTGIVHRDLKPANVMITESGTVKIMDFGIARVLGAEHLTSDGTMMGTPAYMAPEQVIGKDIDARADLYAAGVVFYRLLTGALPFQADTPISMVQKQLWDPPTPVREYRHDLPVWCEELLERALAKSPADRFQTAEEFRHALLSAIGTPAPTDGDGGAYSPIAIAPGRPVAAGAPAPTPVGALTPTEVAQAPTVTLSRATRIPPVEVRETPSTGATPAPDMALPASIADSQQAARSWTTPRIVAASAAGAVMLGTLVFLTRGTPAPVASTTTGASATTALALPVASPVESAVPIAPKEPTGTPAPAGPDAVATNGSAIPAPRARTAATERAPSRLAPTAVAPASPQPEPPPVVAVTPEPASAAEPDTPPAVAPVPPVVFSAQAVVVRGGRNRQRDAIVHLADGQVRVTETNRTVITTVPFSDVLGATYSNSRQPLWNSPQGAAEVVHLDGGAFGFMRGDQHWVSLRTATESVVLRLRDQDRRRVLAALEERLGRKVEMVEPPK